jgi:hypothetical protein
MHSVVQHFLVFCQHSTRAIIHLEAVDFVDHRDDLIRVHDLERNTHALRKAAFPKEAVIAKQQLNKHSNCHMTHMMSAVLLLLATRTVGITLRSSSASPVTRQEEQKE